MHRDQGLDPQRLPLSDVRVISIEQYGAGPWATLQLADLGADVIKIEDPAVGGDVARYIPPYQRGEDSLFFETFNRNKRSISLDLRHHDARPVLEDLAARADAVYCNLRGDLPARLGLTYESLCHANPRIVCCSLSGFGRTGPRAALGAYDNVVQGLAGWMSVTGDPDGPPTKTGLSLVDYSAGYVSVLALLAGIWRARREGIGCDCDVSLFETALAQLAYLGTWAATEEYAPTRAPDSAHLSIVPFQNFATADGTIAVACSKEHLWRRFCAGIDRLELIDDPRFADFARRHEHRDELVATLRATIALKSSEYWMTRFAEHGVPAGTVNDVAEALRDEQVVARGGIVEIDHPRLGPVRHVASPLRVGSEAHPRRRAPYRGEHSRAVLRELCGYGEDRISELATSGVLGGDDADI